ncbi:hypothetical protein HJ122_24820 [Vibrio parahaemolyticus]|nr:hypothetical protein [Vibrio parahaemolyticus]
MSRIWITLYRTEWAPLDAIGTLLGGQTNVTISDGNFEAVLNFMSTSGLFGSSIRSKCAQCQAI